MGRFGWSHSKGIHFKEHAVYYLALSRIYTLRRVFLSGGILHPQYPSAASGYYYLEVSNRRRMQDPRGDAGPSDGAAAGDTVAWRIIG